MFGVFSLTGGRPGHRWLLLGIGILATTTADAVYLFQSAEGTYVEGTWIDVLWPAAMLLVASCGMGCTTAARGELEVEGRPLLAVPAVCALVATGILVYDHFSAVNLLAIVLATATLCLVIVRLAADVPREPPPVRADAPRRRRPTRSPGSATAGKLLTDLERRSRREPVDRHAPR